MRKISTLLMLFCAFVCTAWAAPTDFPVMSEGENIKWYTLSNTRSTSGKYLYWTASGVKDSNERTAASFFYFTGSADSCYIHNYATDLLFSGAGAWTDAGVACSLSVSPLGTGFMIGFNGTFLNEQNYANGFTTWGDVNDAGSIFVVEEITDFSAVIDVPAAKEAAIAELTNLASVSTIYPAATTAIAAVNAVSEEDKSLAGLNAAVEAVNKVVVDYKAEAYNALSGKYFSIQTRTAERSKGFMEMATTKVVGTAALASPAGIWQFVSNNDGTLKVFNPYIGKYLCEPQGNSAEVAVTTDANNAGNYTLNVNPNAEVSEAKVKFTSNGKSVHMAGGGTLVRWDNGGASEWAVIEVADFSAIIDAYKTATISTLDQWATLSVVFDAALIATSKTNITAVNTNTWETFAAIDAELTKVTDAVAAKMFTFQTLATDNGRNGVWISANPATGKTIGADNQDYNAVWSLRHAGGVSFYLFNELNQVYMGNPDSSGALTEAPSASYTFEMITDKGDNVVELKCGGQTLHASNHGDNKLLNWDGNEDASRWYINTIDVTADIQNLLNSLTPADYADVPALGQYTTAGYNALVEAAETVTTVDEVKAAIAAFNKTKNIPVYFITSAWDGYSAGKAILYDGTAWKFATADKFNRQMWMTIPEYTNEDVPTVDAYDAEGVHYAICDYLTNTVMRDKNVQIVNVEGWEGAMNLQYSANNAQHADQYGVLVEWRPAKVVEGAVDCGASAWHVEYIGTSYELDKLTDELFAGVNALASRVDDEVEFGTEVGYYSEEAYTAAKAAAEAIVAKSLVELTAISVADVQAAEANLNKTLITPDPNKYYMLESASTKDYCAGQRVYVAKDGYMGFNNENLMANVFQFVPAADGKFYLSHVETGSALSTAKAAGWGAQAAHTALYDVEPVAVSISNMGSKNIVKLVPDGGPMIHAQKDGSQVVGWDDDSYEGASAWYIKEVDINNYAHELTVTDAEWATLVLGFNTVIPEDVTAYIVSAVGAESATLTPVEGVLPANTPVLLNAPAEIYSFTVSTETPEEISNNILDGCTIDRHVYEDIYVLGNGTDGVGFYKAKYNVNTDSSNDIVEGEGEDAVTTPTYEAILSNAFKAFLPANGVAAQALRFNFGGTTAIESVVNGINANAAIYDLSGRRVEKATKGIYIVNGKKMIVK